MWWPTCRNRAPLPGRGSGGMTLLELMLALALFALLAAMVFSVVFASSRRSRTIGDEVRLRWAAAAILDLMAEDIRGAFLPVGQAPFLLGEDRWHEDRQTDALDLVTTASLPVSPEDATGGLSEVGYRMDWDDVSESGTLRRREQYPPDTPEEEGGVLTEVSGDLVSLNIRYFDGNDWWDRWDSGDTTNDAMDGRLPVEVEVELTLVADGREATVRTRVAPVMAGGQP